MNQKLFKETCKKFPSIICDLENFEQHGETTITDKRILQELEYTLEKVNWDGWEPHLESYQKTKSLECLISKYKEAQ